MNNDRLPDGSSFLFWNDGTRYTKEYHVAVNHPQASDQNPGTAAAPFLTINKAAGIVQPGEKVVVHEGIYRECVQPARSGMGRTALYAFSNESFELLEFSSDGDSLRFRDDTGTYTLNYEVRVFGDDDLAPIGGKGVGTLFLSKEVRINIRIY